MKRYNLPDGYSFLPSLVRTYKQVKDPIGTMAESMKRFNGTYTVNLGSKRLIATQDQGFIDHVLKNNHRNYHKSPILTLQMGRFLGNGLLTSNGEYWLRQRRLIQPGFHMDKIQALYAIMQKAVDDFLVQFPIGAAIDIYPLMNKLSFEIVVNTLFDVPVPEEHRQALVSFISETQAFIVKDVRQPHKSWWFKLSGEVAKNLNNAKEARDIIRSIIKTRRASTNKFNDLLDMLLDTRYEDTGLGMSEEQIIDEILILLIAGHETTGNVLSWTLYLLATHPQQMHKLRSETKDLTLKETIQNDTIASVIKESMRLYPPAWITDRISMNDDAYQDFTFPKDTIILLFFYGLHHDGKYWTNPSSFAPERFLKENADKDKLKAYYPFGAGPRLCIGNGFAMAEMAIFLQAFVQRFTIQPSGNAPAIQPLVTLRPDQVLLNVNRI